MSAENLEGGRAERTRFLSGKLGSTRRSLTGNVVLVDGDPFVHFLDPNGSDRTLALPALSSGDDWRVVAHVGSANTITINYSSGTLVTVLAPGESTICFGSSVEWKVLRGYSTFGDVFGPAGVGHVKGLVPDPGAVAGLHRFLQDDGTWTSVTTAGIVDAYKQISDGTNLAVASGLTQLRLRSSDTSVTLTVTDNDPTFGDVVNFVVAPGSVNHNLLLNYVANQHVDHTAVSVATSEGIQGGGTIAATRTHKLDFSGLGTSVPVLTDTVAYFQTATHFKTTWATINAAFQHNNLAGYVADQHVAHSGISITAGSGLTGGGTIDLSRTLNVSFTSGFSTVTTMASSDLLPFSHAGALENITFANFNGSLDHNILLNYVANQHIDHTSVSISAGTGLSGGGTIAANRTLSITSTIVAAGPVGDATHVPAVTFNAQGQLTTVSSVSILAANANLANMATMTIKSNITGAPAAPSDNTLTALLDAALGSTRGMLMIRGATVWSALPIGTNTQVLTSNGTDPSWSPSVGGGGGTETFTLHAGIGGL